MHPMLLPYFAKARGSVEPGCHRMLKLLTPFFKKELFQNFFSIPSILVAGSNGKGTTCAYLESILRAHNLRTGLYTSPHLVHPQERIRISGNCISEEQLIAGLEEVEKVSKKYLPTATFFEVMTVTAFLVFFRRKVDVLICEVGLGGRLDSTNILSPCVSVVTNVSLEHTEILGKTLEEIAYEKAFVGRRNHPLVLGRASEGVLTGFKKAQNVIGFELISAQPQSDEENLGTVLACLNQLPSTMIPCSLDKIRLGIENTLWPGRFDVRKITRQGNTRTVVLDCAHTSDGVRHFLNHFSNRFQIKKNPFIVFASMKDKDWEESLKRLSTVTSSIILTKLSSPGTANPHEISQKIFHTTGYRFVVKDCLDLALSAAFLSTTEEQPIVILGSVAFVGEAFQLLHLSPFPVEKKLEFT